MKIARVSLILAAAARPRLHPRVIHLFPATRVIAAISLMPCPLAAPECPLYAALVPGVASTDIRGRMSRCRMEARRPTLGPLVFAYIFFFFNVSAVFRGSRVGFRASC